MTLHKVSIHEQAVRRFLRTELSSHFSGMDGKRVILLPNQIPVPDIIVVRNRKKIAIEIEREKPFQTPESLFEEKKVKYMKSKAKYDELLVVVFSIHKSETIKRNTPIFVKEFRFSLHSPKAPNS